MVLEHFSQAAIPFPKKEEVATNPQLPGILVPHLDFRVGGHVYPHGFVELIRSKAPEVVVILGVSHRSHTDVSVSRRGVQTIFGESPHALETYDALRDCCSNNDIFQDNEQAFDEEHSIEFPMVYLHCLASFFPQFSGIQVLPAICGGMFLELAAGSPYNSNYEHFGKALNRVISESGKKISLIVSIDGAHVGPRFGARTPVSPQKMLEISQDDYNAFKAAASGMPEMFFKTFIPKLNNRNFDGVGALFVALKALQNIAVFELKNYHQWFWPPDKSLVSIASGVFRAHTKQV